MPSCFTSHNGVSPDEMIEFARLYAGVVNPGGRYSINPYYLGYTILVDIEKRRIRCMRRARRP